MKQNPSDMEDNGIDVDEIVRRIFVKTTLSLENYLQELKSNDVPKMEEHNPEQTSDDVRELKVTMIEPAEIEELSPNSEHPRNVSLIKDLNPTAPLFTAQMLKKGRRNKILMKNGISGVFEPEFVPMYEFDLVAKKFVQIGKIGGNLFYWGLYKNDDKIHLMFFYICLGFIWHPNAGVG